MADKVWSNVNVAFQSALVTAITVDGISNLSPPVVTFTGTDPANGDYVLLTVEGMEQVNNRVFRVASLSAGVSFELEGEDATGYGTFTSGTAQVVTFGNTLNKVTEISQAGGDPTAVDNTTIHQQIRTEIVTGANPISYDITNKWDPANAGLAAMRVAFDNLENRVFKFTFADGSLQVFNASVGAANAAGGSAGGLVTTPAALKAQGFPTTYAS
jgi:hypothetical protein